MGARRGWLWLLLGSAACAPNATSSGSHGGGNSIGDQDDLSGGDMGEDPSSGGDTGPGTVTGNPGGTTNDPPPPPADTGDDVGETTMGDPSAGDATTGDGTPSVDISDGPTFDFGALPIGNSGQHVFTVTNFGDGPATGLVGQALSGEFSYQGGAYPGLGGNCGSVLEPGSSCLVSVTFGPTTFGPQMATLTLNHDDGTASRGMQGGGTGVTDNLLVNPGGESAGSPPPGWQDTANGEWATSAVVTPQQGSAMIAATTGNDNQTYRLVQAVDVSQWAGLIDAGLLRIDSSGYGRTWSSYNDQYRIIVRFRDGGGTEIDNWNSGWWTGGGWNQLSDSRNAPAGTRTIAFELGCSKTGGTNCDAYYDSLLLRAAYP